MYIISGGQTGTDQAALEVAEKLGFITKGFCAKLCKTEDGIRPDLMKRFHLKEVGVYYPERSIKNVEIADAGLLFGKTSSSSYKFIAKEFRKYDKPFMFVPYPRVNGDFDTLIDKLTDWLYNLKPKALFITGNRESVASGIHSYVTNVVTVLLTQYEAKSMAAQVK